MVPRVVYWRTRFSWRHTVEYPRARCCIDRQQSLRCYEAGKHKGKGEGHSVCEEDDEISLVQTCHSLKPMCNSIPPRSACVHQSLMCTSPGASPMKGRRLLVQ